MKNLFRVVKVSIGPLIHYEVESNIADVWYVCDDKRYLTYKEAEAAAERMFDYFTAQPIREVVKTL
jgi:hypothetical protein